MIDLFQAATNHKPASRAIHKFNQSLTAKWVPVNKSFITLSKIILRAAVERLNLAQAAVSLSCVTHEGYRHLVLVNGMQDMEVAVAGTVEEFIISTQEALASPFEDFVAATTFSLPLDFTQSQGPVQRLGYLVAQVATSGIAIKPEQLTKELGLVADEIMRIIGRGCVKTQNISSDRKVYPQIFFTL